MKKINFPISKKTLKKFTRWQAEGKTSTVTLDDIFNNTIRAAFDKGTISLLMDNNASLRDNKAGYGKVSVYLDNDIYAKLEDCRMKYSDFKYARLKESIAVLVEIYCQKADELITPGI